MRTRTLLFLVLALLSASQFVAAQPAALPKVVLIGDSIRMGYAPTVTKQLEGKAVIAQSKANGGDSANVVKKLAEAIAEKPDVVHFNCGIHDTKKDKKTAVFQITPEQYEANLRQIVDTLRKETKAVVIFATTTPIIDDRAAKQRTEASYELLDASTVEYNRIAMRVMEELKVPVNDLRAVCGEAADRANLMTDDGVHFTAAGKTKLGNAVAEFISKHLPTK
ncbi:SGNH/GDSL hydrolase family protein [Anatilimnocola sp. NA78]|uniref:SGNH/GDSL hydrolase family protein n=1 Tax=Anatilimnocola sp. NA78 TaxID=3415683 RepID=UPI003CE44AFC